MEITGLARRAASLSPTAAAPPRSGMIGFDSGHAFPGILPDLRRAAALALGEYRHETLQYSERAGLPEMREWIAAHMCRDGSPVTVDEIAVVNGAKHGIELLCRLLLDEGDTIVVTAPTYFTSIPIFRSFGARFIEVEQDEEGIDVEAIKAALDSVRRDGSRPPKFIYDIPDFHNPTGITTSRRRREALVALAARHSIPVIEDSPYREVRFEGEVLPTLRSLASGGSVISVGTFAKLVAPGLRIGWIAAPVDLIRRILLLKADGGSSPLVQRILLEFFRADGLPAHIETVRATYRDHRDAMVTSLRRHLPTVEFTIPSGGYYVWLRLPEGVDGEIIADRAASEGVSVIAGHRFFAADATYPRNRPSPRNNVRVAYSHASPTEIEEGVKRLARAFVDR